MHVRVRRGAHAINLSEFPMVLGLLAFDPVTVILARALGGGAGLFVLRRQRGAKLAFNVALLAAQASRRRADLRRARAARAGRRHRTGSWTCGTGWPPTRPW